jgi:hypothetical protein
MESLHIRPSPLRPECTAEERILIWKGVNQPPLDTIDHPLLKELRFKACAESLKDRGSYGAGLRKFHLFCDIFDVPEQDRLPASVILLHSFALWAATDADITTATVAFAINPVPSEPVATETVKKYLTAVRAWHIIQGWPPPYSDTDLVQIKFSLRGLARMSTMNRRRPLRPPMTIPLLHLIRSNLDVDSSFDASVWATCTCCFFGLMRLGEATSRVRASFDPNTHATRAAVSVSQDAAGIYYARIDLPAAKTAAPGQVQSVFLAHQEQCSPVAALLNMFHVTPAELTDPLFSWKDIHNTIRPLTRSAVLKRLNTILVPRGFGTSFGHSFRIGGACFFLAQGRDPQLIQLAGRWRSQAWQVYTRPFALQPRHCSLTPLPSSHAYLARLGASGVRLVGFGLGIDAPRGWVRASVTIGLTRSRQDSSPNLTARQLERARRGWNDEGRQTPRAAGNEPAHQSSGAESESIPPVDSLVRSLTTSTVQLTNDTRSGVALLQRSRYC